MTAGMILAGVAESGQ